MDSEDEDDVIIFNRAVTLGLVRDKPIKNILMKFLPTQNCYKMLSNTLTDVEEPFDDTGYVYDDFVEDIDEEVGSQSEEPI